MNRSFVRFVLRVVAREYTRRADMRRRREARQSRLWDALADGHGLTVSAPADPLAGYVDAPRWWMRHALHGTPCAPLRWPVCKN